MTTSCRDMVNVYSVITPTSSSFTHSLSQHSSLSSALHRLVAPLFRKLFGKYEEPLYRIDVFRMRRHFTAKIKFRAYITNVSPCYVHFIIYSYEKKIDFYKRKLKLADLLCLLQCVVCLRRVIIVLNGKSKLTARTPVYYSI